MFRKILLFFLFIPLLPTFCTGNTEYGKADSASEIRIVSLAPNITEIIHALGEEGNLKGRTDVCNYPEKCKNIQSVGSPWKPNIELIIRLNPTVVIASSLTDGASLKQIEKSGIKVERINNENTLKGTYETINRIGELIGCADKAHKLSQSLENRIENVKKMTEPIKNRKTAVYLMSWGAGGDYAATGDTYINGILEAAGLINIAENSSFWLISKELLVKTAPDYIFVPVYSNQDCDISFLENTKPYSTLHSKIVKIDGDAIERQGVRTADITEELAKIVYGDSLK